MLEITSERQANLLKLARYLERLPEGYAHFNMLEFMSGVPEVSDFGAVHERVKIFQTKPCGAVACAVGHGPLAGLPFLDTDYSWNHYSERVFGLNGDGAENWWYWCFSGNWASSDNTPQGAAKRIRWFLKHGVPDNWENQQTGIEPLCYVETTDA